LSFDVVLAPTGSGGWLSFVPSSSWTYREVPNPYEETNEMGGPVSMTKVVVVRSAEYENGSDPGRLDIIAGYLSFQ
jgi:hypothetical protein